MSTAAETPDGSREFSRHDNIKMSLYIHKASSVFYSNSDGRDIYY